MSGGTVLTTGSSVLTELRMSNGRYLQGTSAGWITKVTQSGGYIDYRSLGQIQNLTVLGGTFDLMKDGRPKSILTLTVHPPGVLIPNAQTAITEGGSIYPLTTIGRP